MHSAYHSAYLRESRSQKNVCACVCLWCGIVTVAIILVCVTLGLRYSGSRQDLSFASSLGDTRLLSYSAPLCSGGEMSLSSPGYNGGMYFLDQKPPLNAFNTLRLSGSFEINPTAYDNYYFYYYQSVFVAWEFHLNPGSTMYVSTCLAQSNGGGANFLVIQGSHNYNRWVNGYVSGATYDYALPYCGNQQTLVQSYSISDEAYYYVVFYVTTGTPLIRLGLTINRTEYSLDGISGMPNCTLDSSSGSCSAESLSSTKYVLFQTVPPNSFNISRVQGFTLDWTCYPRNNVYVAIFFVPLIILSLLFCACFGIYCSCTYIFLRKSRYDELKEDHAHVHSQPVSEKPPPAYTPAPI